MSPQKCVTSERYDHAAPNIFDDSETDSQPVYLSIENTIKSFLSITTLHDEDSQPVCISLEKTIQDFRNGDLGTPKYPRATVPSAFDPGAEEYDTALLNRKLILPTLAIRPRAQPDSEALGPTAQACELRERDALGLPANQPQKEAPEGRATTAAMEGLTERSKQRASGCKLPAKPTVAMAPGSSSSHVFEQFLPTGSVFSPDEPADATAAKAQKVVDEDAVIQPCWERAYADIRRTGPRLLIQNAHEKGKGSTGARQNVDGVPACCPLGVRLPPGKDAQSRKHERRQMKPSEVCVPAMEDRQRSILGDIMNRQYIRRRKSDD
ncbi:hypothetical protein DFH06DRAFT_1181293 [Mycena polygramma]|nr:hypothetical protein DFH06DRAFT_1181293 [Mycena polygramma]